MGSDAQHCLVGVFDLLVGPGKTIACVVDLLLGEILDHEEMLSGIARFAQFSMSCDDVRTVDHKARLAPTRCGGCLQLGLCHGLAVFALGVRSYAANCASGCRNSRPLPPAAD